MEKIEFSLRKLSGYPYIILGEIQDWLDDNNITDYLWISERYHTINGSHVPRFTNNRFDGNIDFWPSHIIFKHEEDITALRLRFNFHDSPFN